jgi:hypothetical protein
MPQTGTLNAIAITPLVDFIIDSEPSADMRITEDAQIRITEGGDTRIIE